MTDRPVSPRSSAHRADERLTEAVGKLARGWIRLAREEARGAGLTLPQLFVLGGLRDAGALPVTRWATMFGASPSATTGILDSLESEGFIRRSHGSVDRRQVLVSLTAKGARHAERLREDLRERWRTIWKDAPATEIEAATGALEGILSRLESSFPTLTADRHSAGGHEGAS